MTQRLLATVVGLVLSATLYLYRCEKLISGFKKNNCDYVAIPASAVFLATILLTLPTSHLQRTYGIPCNGQRGRKIKGSCNVVIPKKKISTALDKVRGRSGTNKMMIDMILIV